MLINNWEAHIDDLIEHTERSQLHPPAWKKRYKKATTLYKVHLNWHKSASIETRQFNMFRALGDMQQPVLGVLERALASRKPPPLPVVYPQGIIDIGYETPVKRMLPICS